jgi:predicted AlkP superfamily phosphohydrolase/phosphomutase
MSDHGFTYAERQVYVNHWLRENGFQSLDRTPADSFEDIASGTRAFALDPSRVYVHVKGKYPRGTVNPGGEYERVRDDIKAGLLSLEIEGRRVIKSVHTKEELYSGAESGRAPDLVLLSNYGFDLKGALSRDVLHDKGPLTGMHTQDDAMIILNGECNSSGLSGTPTILDASATLCRLAGIEAGDIEGRPF